MDFIRSKRFNKRLCDLADPVKCLEMICDKSSKGMKALGGHSTGTSCNQEAEVQQCSARWRFGCIADDRWGAAEEESPL